MRPLKTFILEDNPEDLELLLDLLSESEYKNDISIHGIARSFKEAVLMLTKETFELSILDFELDNNHDLDDVADIVGPGNMGIIALHTKTQGRSHASAEKLPMDIYMGKPFSELGMLEFIKKLRAVRVKSKGDEKIRIKENGETILIDFKDILFVRGNKNYTDFICRTSDGMLHIFKAQGSLGQFEEELSDSRFIRCHLSYIINKEKIINTN